jgi:NAD(P)-dependent dehydrogenase (short-subunit alcohol dehydrogenase family)
VESGELPPSARHLPAATFAGQVALVTGGGTGLGLEISRGLAALGARVVIASRDAAHHAALLGEARSRGWSVEAIALDVREAAAVERAAAELRERLGPLRILVNNAAGNFVCPAERLSARGWRAVLGIVLDGTFFCSRYFGAGMLRDGGGQILNVVATYAWTGMPGVVHSASAKAGVLALTRTLAVEWARHGVRVNAVAPGPFHSEGAAANLWPDERMRERIERAIPLGRLGTAEEVAGHCLYLLSPACAYVTGECFVVDGGLSLGRNLWPEGERAQRAPRDREGA